MDKNPTTLIIIRGNSGSGKSTLAKQLRVRMVEFGLKTALVEQDYLRRIVLQEKEHEGGNNIELIEQTAVFALTHGYCVVLEGILHFKRYGPMLRRLLKSSTQCYLYYMDVPFEETLRRHTSKPNKHEFGESELRQWWHELDVTNFPNEQVLPAHFSRDQSLEKILGDIDM